MTFTDAHDADTGHVLLDTDTFEHAMAELLSPGPLSLSPLLDVDGVDDRFGLRGDFPSPNAGSAARASEELSGGGAVSKMSDDSRALGDSRSDKENPAARGKKRRVNTNQAEVQKRYRERKKSKLEDLERTVAELREQVRSLRSKSRSGSDSPRERPRERLCGEGPLQQGLGPRRRHARGAARALRVIFPGAFALASSRLRRVRRRRARS